METELELYISVVCSLPYLCPVGVRDVDDPGVRSVWERTDLCTEGPCNGLIITEPSFYEIFHLHGD